MKIKLITDLSKEFYPQPKPVARMKAKDFLKEQKKKPFFTNTMEGKFQQGDYENSKGTMYFRSKWEANIALVLDFLVKGKQIKGWEYEAEYFVFDKIRHGTTRYLPDFKVELNNGKFEYWECKGYMDSRSKTKLKRMAKYYPDVKIVLVDSDMYKDFKKKLGKLCKFY